MKSLEQNYLNIYTKVVADVLHYGHIRFFKAARELGSRLTVCVVPDERVLANKGVKPFFATSERVEMVAACRWVDEVITDGPKLITLQFMQERGFHIYAFGAVDEAELASKLSDCSELPENMRSHVPYTIGISSTIIRQRLSNFNVEK
jgi:cytidyltransferase-like protein